MSHGVGIALDPMQSPLPHPPHPMAIQVLLLNQRPQKAGVTSHEFPLIFNNRIHALSARVWGIFIPLSPQKILFAKIFPCL